MQHRIPVERLGPLGPLMAEAVQACVHCGFCLAACPTYRLLGEEMDAPRGRIFLMKEVLEGELDAREALPYIDRCLGCQACEPACPSGVPYGALLTAFRAHITPTRHRGWFARWRHRLIIHTLPYPGRFRVVLTLGRLARRFIGRLFPTLRPLLHLIPDNLPTPTPLPTHYPAQGRRRARVALLTGCVQSVLAPEINWATLRVLARNGVEVIIPRGQRCCGALALHTGNLRLARRLARHNLSSFPEQVDAILTNAAGCGSGMKEYPLLFKGTPDETAAHHFAQKVRDIHEFLAELGIQPPPPLPTPMAVAYHDACHLANAQRIREAPRQLLQQIPGLTLREIPESELCCGSAGTYNLEQPALAQALGERKARNILATNAQAVVSGNIGCLVQIAQHLRRLNQQLPVLHTMQLLDQAYAQPEAS